MIDYIVAIYYLQSPHAPSQYLVHYKITEILNVRKA